MHQSIQLVSLRSPRNSATEISTIRHHSSKVAPQRQFRTKRTASLPKIQFTHRPNPHFSDPTVSEIISSAVEFLSPVVRSRPRPSSSGVNHWRAAVGRRRCRGRTRRMAVKLTPTGQAQGEGVRVYVPTTAGYGPVGIEPERW